MMKLFFPAATALLMGLASAQAQTATDSPHGRHRHPEPEKAAAPPASPAMADWFGNAVEDILTGADKALNIPPPNQPASPAR